MEMPVDARPQVRKNRRRIHGNTLRGFQGETTQVPADRLPQ
jgi:hypothetical protein